ncbi:MAG: cytochrome c [Porphyrobacter sp.]|nr:cytochrome c [Porphyrobacter sp.]
MKRLATIPALALLLAACDTAPAASFKDASLTLPDDPLDLPEGPGRDAVIENCTACHSPSTMLQQPKVSPEKWKSIIGKMKTLYKAPIDDAAVPAIVEYMVHVQSQPEPGA